MTKIITKSHAVLGASNCEKWWNCPGSPFMEEAAGQSPPNEYSAQGTVAHTVLEEALQGRAHLIGDVIEQDGFEITVDLEMWEAVCVMRDYIDDLKQRHKLLPEHVIVEKEVQLPGLDLDGTPRFGRLDAAVHVPYQALYVIDFKYGKGVDVDVAENKQLLNYAVGVWDTLSDLQRAEIPVVYLVVIQPRRPMGSPVQTYGVEPARLDTFRVELMAAISAVTPTANLVPGPHCQKYFCGARGSCPALHQLAIRQTADLVVDEPAKALVKRLTPVEKATLLKRKDLVNDLFKVLEDELVADITAGATGTGFKVVDAYGNLKWSFLDKSIAQTELIEKMNLGAEALKPSELKTPTQIKAILKKKKLDIDLSPYTVRPINGRKLAPDTDERPSSDCEFVVEES